ncbi:hypothetical protein [Persicobacter diffluens]|uniref:Uncharacterized protein n=1 Tax=Persicobacter diffluens TaxID=981 RepID=A0AAN4VXR0_9BACT|nr:hypothetical protein PEDI_15430 [Persicobacter diffluens]
MKFKPVICPISSGIKITIREAHPGDALALTGCIQAYLKNQTIPLTKDEYQPSPKEQGKWISKFQEGQHDLLLLAEHEGRIIGNIDLSMHHRKNETNGSG